MRLRGGSGPVVGAGLLFAGGLHAESTLEWRTPDGCPGHARVVERVEELAPAALAEAEPASRFVAEVTELSGGRWRLVLRSTRAGVETERRIEGDSCAALADAAAAAIALALRPPLDDRVVPVEAAPEPPLPAPPAAVKPEASATVPAPTEPIVPVEPAPAARAEPPKPLLRWLGGSDLAAFPAGALAFELDLGVRLGEVLSLEGAGILLPPARYSLGGGADARFWLAAGGPRLCAHTHEGRIGLAACAGTELGSIVAEGQGVSEAARRRVSWVAPAGTLLVTWPLGKAVRLVGLGSALVPLVRHDFRIPPEDPFHRLPAVDGRLAAGLQFGAR